MKEAQRFLRYVIPGLIFLIEVSLYLFLSTPYEFVQFVKDWKLLKNSGTPISTFLISGGLGFFFGVFYHVLYWRGCLPVVKHCRLIKVAINRNWLKLNQEFNVKELDQMQAMCLIMAFWHERKESSIRIKEANPRVESLTDIMHGLGTAFIGSIIAIPLWLFIYWKFAEKSPCTFSFVITLIISLLVVITHYYNYKNVVTNVQRVVNIIIADELEEEYSKKRTPLIMNVIANDFNQKHLFYSFCKLIFNKFKIISNKLLKR